MSDEQRDPDKRVFPPPDKSVECSCLHCGRVYTSDMMIEVEIDGEYHYACPVKGCTAMGWNFDIFSMSEDDGEDGGWVYTDDEDDEFDEEEFTSEDVEVVSESDEATTPFDPPRDWSPEVDAEDRENEFSDNEFGDDDFASEDEDAFRGTPFTREEYDRLKAAGEYDRKIEEIREQWRRGRDDRPPRDPTQPLSDDDIPF